MPLSPTVKVGGDHCSRTVAALLQLPPLLRFYPFLLRSHLSVTPLRYKRRPGRNVRGGSAGSAFATQTAHTLGVASSSSSRAPQFNTNQAGVGFYASIAARTWVNRPCARLDLLFVLPPPSHRTNEGAPAP